jgi:hypothetical protein
MTRKTCVLALTTDITLVRFQGHAATQEIGYDCCSVNLILTTYNVFAARI